MARKTVSLNQRTHARLTALNDGYGDSADKIVSRLISFYLKWKGKVEK